MRLCTTCPNYPTCTNLCLEAEAYVNQDEVPQREIPVSNLTDIPIEEFVIDGIRYSSIDYHDIVKAQTKYQFSDKIFDILFAYYVEGRNQPETALIHFVSKQYVHKIIHKYPIC